MNQKIEKHEVVVPERFRLDEVMDFDDEDFCDEPPIYAEEVKLRFERDDDK